MTALRQRMIEDMRLRNLSPHTIDAYVLAVKQFAKHVGRSPEQLDAEQARQYLVHLVQEKHVSWSRYNVSRCGLQFLYRVTEYNQQRPHEGLPDMATPASLYVPSSRAYPDRLEELEYPAGYQRRRVDAGKFSWHDRKVFVSHALEDETIGLGPLEFLKRRGSSAAGRYWLVRFATLDLGIFDVDRGRLLRPREKQHLLA